MDFFPYSVPTFSHCDWRLTTYSPCGFLGRTVSTPLLRWPWDYGPGHGTNFIHGTWCRDVAETSKKEFLLGELSCANVTWSSCWASSHHLRSVSLMKKPKRCKHRWYRKSENILWDSGSSYAWNKTYNPVVFNSIGWHFSFATKSNFNYTTILTTSPLSFLTIIF